MDANGRAGTGGSPPGGGEPPVVATTLSVASDALAFFERCRDEVDSEVVGFEGTGGRGYVLTHPADVERVLVSDAPSFGKGDVARDSLGIGLPTSLVVTEGERWHRDRTALQPLFYRDRLSVYGDEMAAVAGEAVDRWTPGEPVSVTDQTKRLTLRVLTQTLLDVDLGAERLDDIETATAALRRRFDSQRLSTYLPPWAPTPTNVRAGLALADFYDLVGGLVSERRAELGDPRALDPADVDRADLLTLLLTTEYPDGTPLDNRTIRDQLVTFLVAGHETTALTLTYACYLLAIHPERQARLREEIEDGVSGDPDAEAVTSLSFLDAIVSEALRLYPPAAVVFREPEEAVTIRGYEIPAGSVLAMPQWLVHRDPRWWDKPESFRPERFLAETDRPEFAFFPFGGGPRHCVGMRFARLEAKIALATILSRYRLEPGTEPPLSVKIALTLQPDEPVTVVPREL